jgi:hypothetical protein
LNRSLARTKEIGRYDDKFPWKRKAEWKERSYFQWKGKAGLMERGIFTGKEGSFIVRTFGVSWIKSLV